MRPENFNIQSLIDSLRGTCSTIQEQLPEGMEEDDLTQKDHESIDTEIFRCTSCGWWEDQPAVEVDGEWYCNDCVHFGDEDDEEE